ncbi:MAG TPA: TolC family protein [Thermoanaerobaculia bacterium]|nr:TolC family protein [Thermoanaerobaculia bacterium]
MKGTLWAAALGLAMIVPALDVSAQAASAEPPELTLESALSIAFEQNRRLASAALEVGKAQDRLGATKAQRYPTVSLDATAARTLNTVEINIDEGVFGTYPGIGPIPSANTKVTSDPHFTVIGLANAKQPLSQLYKIGLGVKAREELLEEARQDLRSSRQSLALQVRKAYYAIVSAEGALASAKESLAFSRETQRVVASRVLEKASLAHDEVDARASLARAEYDVASYETSVAAAKEQLNILLGREVATEFRVAALPEPRPLPREHRDAVERATLNRPDVRRAKLQASTAELDAKLAKAEFLPDVSLSMTYFSPYDVQFQPKAIWSAGLLVQWDIFDGGKRARQLAEKRKAQEQARLAAADAEANARMESSRDWRRLQDAVKLVESAQLARNAMRDRARVIRVRYENQATLAQDLFRAQADLADADRRCNESLVSYWSARADYEASTGEDL